MEPSIKCLMEPDHHWVEHSLREYWSWEATDQRIKYYNELKRRWNYNTATEENILGIQANKKRAILQMSLLDSAFMAIKLAKENDLKVKPLKLAYKLFNTYEKHFAANTICSGGKYGFIIDFSKIIRIKDNEPNQPYITRHME